MPTLLNFTDPTVGYWTLLDSGAKASAAWGAAVGESGGAGVKFTVTAGGDTGTASFFLLINGGNATGLDFRLSVPVGVLGGTLRAYVDGVAFDTAANLLTSAGAGWIDYSSLKNKITCSGPHLIELRVTNSALNVLAGDILYIDTISGDGDTLSARPTTPEINTSEANFGSTVRAFVAFSEGSGLPVANFTGAVNIPGSPTDCYSGGATGILPAWDDDNIAGGPAMRWIHGSRGFRFHDAGWKTANMPATGVIACVFKAKWPVLPSTTTKSAIICGNGGDATCFGPGVQIVSAGTQSFGFFRAGGMVFPTSALTLTAERTYIAAVEFTSTARKYYLYDYTSKALVSAAAGQSGSADSALGSDATYGDLMLNALTVFTNPYNPFIGELSAVMFDGQAWDATKFAAFVADPWSVVRGSYAPGAGALVAGQFEAWGDHEQIHYAGSRPTSGASAGVYTHQVQRAFQSDFSDVANITGATALVGSIANLAQSKTYYLRCQSTDGTTTVTTTGIKINGTATANPSARRQRGYHHVAFIGDSIVENTGPFHMARLLVGKQWRCAVLNRAKASSAAYHATTSLSWQPDTTLDPINGQAGTVLLSQFISQCTAEGITKVHIQLGTNDATIGTTAAQYKIYMGYICTTLLANGIEQIILEQPIDRYDVATYRSLLDTYRPKLQELSNGGTILFSVDANMEYFEGDREALIEALHPKVNGGYESMGINWGIGVLSRLDPYSLGLSSVGFGNFGGKSGF